MGDLRQRRFRVPHLRNDRPARGRPRQYYVRISQVNSRNLTEPEPSDRVLIVEQGCLIHTEVDVMRSQDSTPTRPGRTFTYDDLTVGRSTQDRPVTHCRGASQRRASGRSTSGNPTTLGPGKSNRPGDPVAVAVAPGRTRPDWTAVPPAEPLTCADGGNPEQLMSLLQ